MMKSQRTDIERNNMVKEWELMKLLNKTITSAAKSATKKEIMSNEQSAAHLVDELHTLIIKKMTKNVQYTNLLKIIHGVQILLNTIQ